MKKIFTLIIPIPRPYEQNGGLEYATQLARPAQLLSLWMQISGWSGVLIGTVFAIAASVLGSQTGETAGASLFSSHPGVFSGAAAAIFAGVGWQFIDRAGAANRLASAATRAIHVAGSQATEDVPNPDRAAYDICIEAKIFWLEGRLDHGRLNTIVSKFK